MEAARVKRLTDIKLFDVFSGEKLGLGMTAADFQNPENTFGRWLATWKNQNPLKKRLVQIAVILELG